MPLCSLLLLDLDLLLQLLLHPLLSSTHCTQPLQPLLVLDGSTHLENSSGYGEKIRDESINLSLLPLHSLNLLDALLLFLPPADHLLDLLLP